MESNFGITTSRVLIDSTPEGLVGRGSFGTVRRAVYDGNPVAVKTFHLRVLSRRAAQDFKREAHLLTQLTHHRLVRHYGWLIEPDFSALVMDYLPHGSFFDFYTADILEEPNSAMLPPDFTARLQLAVDVASGMNFLHAQLPTPLLHRDLKSVNALCDHDVNGRLRLKLSDFGLARIKSETNPTARMIAVRGPNGRVLWSAPELNDPHEHFTTSCDVFSFGVLLTEIGSWAGPFTIPISRLSIEDVRKQLDGGSLPELLFPSDVPAAWKDLVLSCLSFDPSLRPRFCDALSNLMKLQAQLPFLVRTAPVDARPQSTDASVPHPSSSSSASSSLLSHLSSDDKKAKSSSARPLTSSAMEDTTSSTLAESSQRSATRNQVTEQREVREISRPTIIPKKRVAFLTKH
ncbi:kinase-like domain-containing protein, partial [Zopfochytrium polystomum]